MQIKAFQYSHSGWSVDTLPALDSDSTLVLSFGAPEFKGNTEPFKSLRKAYPKAIIANCSTAGEILNYEINDSTISVAVIKFEKTKVKKACVNINNSEESFAASEQIATQLKGDDLKSILVLSDGLNVNGTELVSGIQKNLPKHVIITGGLTGDSDQFQETWVLDKPPQTKIISAIGFYGNKIHVSYGPNSEWHIFGPKRIITKSKENTLYELDHQGALTLYKKYLGECAKGLPATGLLFPLAISEPKQNNKVVRTILSVNENDDSLTFASNMPEGWNAQLMCANFDRLVDGVTNAANSAKKNISPNPKDELLVIAISCVGRRLALGERTEEEIDAVLDTLPKNSKLIGFYSYGEIPPSCIHNCDLHNQTITTLYEETSK